MKQLYMSLEVYGMDSYYHFQLMAKTFSTSFTVDNYLMEVSFVKEDGVFVYGIGRIRCLLVDLFVDGIPYMDLICLFDLDEEDRLCIERGEVPKKKKRQNSSPDDDDIDFDAPIERRVLHRKHHNYLSSQGFGDMDEEEMRKSTVFENLQEKMAAMKLQMDIEDAGVEVSDVDEEWEEEQARRHLKDLSKKVVVPEKQKKVKVIKPKYKKKDGEMYGQLQLYYFSMDFYSCIHIIVFVV